MFFIAYTFKGQVHVFSGRVKIVSQIILSPVLVRIANREDPDQTASSEEV